MKFIKKLVAPIYKWAQGANAWYVLFIISFLQAICLPVAIDLLLLPLMIARPTKANFYVMLVILGLFLGGVIGYFLGQHCFDLIIAPLLENSGYTSAFVYAKSLFNQYGSLILLVSGFIPLPYMLFPITAGVLQLGFMQFMLASISGRIIRYGLVGLLFKASLTLKVNDRL